MRAQKILALPKWAALPQNLPALPRSPIVNDHSLSSCVSVRMQSIDSPKNSFWKKQLCKEWFAHVIARTARTDDNNNNTHLFSLLSIIKFNRFLLNFRCIKHMVNTLSCTVELWMHLRDVLGGLLSSQELEVYSLLSKTSSAFSIGIWSTLALLNLNRRMF